jgi:hypothetical protein
VSAICFTAGSSHASRKERIPPTISGGDPLHQLLLDPLVDRPEEVALVLEMVVEGATRDPCAGDDLLGPDPGVAARGEELEARPNESLAGRPRPRVSAGGRALGCPGT